MTNEASVLVVDDEEEVAETYAQTLGDRYDITIANSGTQALDKVDDSIDIVLLDRRMPEMHGDEVLEEIRDRGYDCRIVMVTAVEPDIDIITMEFDEYLVKPVTAEQIRDVVARMLTRKELTEQIQQMFSLSSRLATLESKLDYDQLDESEEYDALRKQFDEVREQARLPDGADDPYLEATLEKLEALLSGRR